jgi:alpha-tubulin suppressor-like RCC1 family protein
MNALFETTRRAWLHAGSFARSLALAAGCLLAFAAANVPAQIIKLPPPRLPDPEAFKSITAGAYHTCATKNNGNTYCWGLNSQGQVGIASTATCGGQPCVDRPRFVMTTWQVDAGHDHTCALTSSGAAYCWGNSNYGQLGNGNYGYQSQPIAVAGGITFSSISAGQYSTCGTSSSGMYCWGVIMNAVYGTPLPTLVFSWNGYTGVSVGYNHACALYVVGSWREVDCWGNNRYGQVGVDPAVLPIAPPTVRSSFDVNANVMAAQSYYTCVDQMTTGVVQCLGYNGYGQLGNGTYNTTWQAQTVGGGMALQGVSAGANHACAIDASGGARCWGNGYWGEVGNGASGVFPSPQLVGGGRTYRAIASGYQHTCAIGTDNHIYCWGSNTYGQLGTQYPGGWVSSPVQALDP